MTLPICDCGLAIGASLKLELSTVQSSAFRLQTC